MLDNSTSYCTNCKETKIIDNFRLRSRWKHLPARPCSWCKACEKIKASEYGKRNQEKKNARRRQWAKDNPEKYYLLELKGRLKKMGLSPELAQSYMECQSCQICNQNKQDCGALHIDHCHASGKFRGFLCTNCNNGLGRFKDSPDRLQSAIKYLGVFEMEQNKANDD